MDRVTDTNNCRIPLLVIVGPTAAGKTGFAVGLAETLGGEVVSADSVQVYRYLDIGSAKPTLEERRGVPHYMLDITEPDADFTVFDYQKMAGDCIKKIHERGKLPILAGGTGLYIKALLDGYSFRSGKTDPSIRRKLQDELASYGKEFLYRKLQEVDPSTGERLHINDSKRIIRALEYYYMTGEPISRQQEMTLVAESPYLPVVFGLETEREALYEKINRRVDLMLKNGLLNEVKNLLVRGYTGDLKPMQSLGYRHIIMYLQGKWSWEETVATFKQDTRKFAKRQTTWFRADKRITWLKIEPKTDLQPVFESIYKRIAGILTSFPEI